MEIIQFRRLGLDPAYQLDHAVSFALDFARSHALVTAGDRVVLVRGTVSADAAHNAMLVLEVN